MWWMDPIPALKRQLANEILARVGVLNCAIAADVLGIDETRMSDIRHGRIARFSVERLIRMLAMAGVRVTLRVERPSEPLQWFKILRERREAKLGGGTWG